MNSLLVEKVIQDVYSEKQNAFYSFTAVLLSIWFTNYHILCNMRKTNKQNRHNNTQNRTMIVQNTNERSEFSSLICSVRFCVRFCSLFVVFCFFLYRTKHRQTKKSKDHNNAPNTTILFLFCSLILILFVIGYDPFLVVQN